jgi:hypothetical protein
MVVLERLKVKVAYFHDHFKGHKMNNAMLNCMLERKQENANSFAKQSTEHLVGTQEISDFGSVVCELFRLIVAELH